MFTQNDTPDQNERNLEAQEFLTIPQAAEILGVHKNTVWTRVREGSLPAVRISPRLVRIRKSDLIQSATPYHDPNMSGWAR